MTKFKNNFTTNEQSKKLLDLGVPADSADMYYKQYSDAVIYVGEVGDVPQGKTFYIHEPSLRHINPEGTWTWKDGERIDLSGKVDELRKTDIPCWSVGRLIDISRICTTLPEEEYMFPFWYDTQDNVEWSIRVIESGIRTGNMDFSKLEE